LPNYIAYLWRLSHAYIIPLTNFFISYYRGPHRNRFINYTVAKQRDVAGHRLFLHHKTVYDHLDTLREKGTNGEHST